MTHSEQVRDKNAKVVDHQTSLALVMAAAATAHSVWPLAGKGRKDLIDWVASATLGKFLQLHMPKVCVSMMGEGIKDKAPGLPEGEEFGPLSGGAPRIWL